MLATCLVMLTTCLHFCKQYKPSDHSSAHLPRVYFCNDLALDLAQSKEAVVEVHAHAMHGLLQKEHLVALALRGHAVLLCVCCGVCVRVCVCVCARARARSCFHRQVGHRRQPPGTRTCSWSFWLLDVTP
eukprot:scaffold26789_cov20-Tisochrysis_lutea.AAC.4